jgi:hypothetical protein
MTMAFKSIPDYLTQTGFCDLCNGFSCCEAAELFRQAGGHKSLKSSHVPSEQRLSQ